MVWRSKWPSNGGGCWTSSRDLNWWPVWLEQWKQSNNNINFLCSLSKIMSTFFFSFHCSMLVSYGHCMVSQIQQAQTICLNWSRYTASAVCSSSQARWGLRRSVQYNARPNADSSRNRQVSRARCKRLWGVSYTWTVISGSLKRTRLSVFLLRDGSDSTLLTFDLFRIEVGSFSSMTLVLRVSCSVYGSFLCRSSEFLSLWL